MSTEVNTTRHLRLAVSCALALASAMASAQQAGTASSTSGELEEIIVTGSQILLPEPFAGGQVAEGGRAGILGNLSTLETPFSSTNYTEELMRNQQAKSVADVLLNDPNVRVARGFGNFQEVFMIRGFPAYSDDMTYNGIYGILPRQFVASEFMERVELFRGSSAFLNGAAPGGSNLGGTVNLVPKRAPAEGLTRLTAGWENSSAYYLAADVGRRFGTDNATGIRANVAYRDGETAVEDQDRELTVLSFGIDHQGEKLRLAADIGYQDHHIDSPRPSVTPFGGLPDPADADSNFAQPWTYTDEEQLFGVVRAEYDFTRALSAWVAYGLRTGEEGNVLANPTASADGTTSTYRFDNQREDEVSSGEIGLRWDFATGPIEHRIILSASMFKIDSKNAYAFSSFAGFPGDLYNPVAVDAPDATFFTGGDLDNPRTTSEIETSSYAIADMMTFADGKFILTLGAREQNIQSDDFDYNSGDKLTGYDESEATPIGGIVYRPTDSLSLFANYIEGLVSGGVAPLTGPFPDFLPVSNGGEGQSPIAAEQIEFGVKFETDTFGGSVSLFNVEKDAGYALLSDTGTPENDFVFAVSGKLRHRGVEAGVYGEPLEGVRLIGGATWLDAEYTEDGVGLPEGNHPIGTPELQANFNVEWDLPALQGLTLEARAVYTSSQYADTANTLELDSWTRFDVGARYSTEIAERPFAIRARIDNVTDENDWISSGGFPGFGYLVLGAPRTFVVSASVDF